MSQICENWGDAITHFSDYIREYPDPPFFALKAYSRLIDCYWSNHGNEKLVEKEIRTLADIVNEIADFETQLNLSRDLKWKGMDEIANATFDLGYHSAVEFMHNTSDAYQILRTHWIIEKYAYFVDRYALVIEHGNQILDMIVKSSPSLHEDTAKISYIENQTYLWLAKTHIALKDFAGAKTCLETFINKFPEHAEINYARYELGQIYENENKIEQAQSQYRRVQAGAWKEKAVQRAVGIKTND